MIVTLCQQIFFPTLNKCFWMRSIATFSGLHMELKHKKSSQYPVFAKFAITQMITAAKRSPSYHPHHRPYTSPKSTPPSPSCSSFISSQNILLACPTIPAYTSSGLILPASAIINEKILPIYF